MVMQLYAPVTLYPAPNLLTRQWHKGIICIRNYVYSHAYQRDQHDLSLVS